VEQRDRAVPKIVLHPSRMTCLRHGSGHPPALTRFVDVTPGQRFELAEPHSGCVEHEQRQPLAAR
jgi:hypothetical protein